MIFIYTCSQDGSADLLMTHFGNPPIFRFDVDKTAEYSWDFSRQGFEIVHLPTGRSINSGTLTSFYLRKPLHAEPIDIPKEGCLENWRRSEVNELFIDLYRACTSQSLTVLVHSRNAHYGKLRQMQVAENYFKVADWHIFHGALPDDLMRGKWVAKALTGTPVGQNKVFFVKEVDPAKLDLSYPWFLQAKIDGEDEVTVVYLDGQLFAYRFPRSAITDSEDVRKATFEAPSRWTPCDLAPAEQAAIRSFMSETGYRFGRFDFIRRNGELWFLELNPNGQWAWLDENNRDGLISAIADAIVTEDRRHRHAAATLRPSP